MENEKLISILSHFSIWFAPVILPAAIYFISESEYAKKHSKYAFKYHLTIIALAMLSGLIMHLNIYLGIAVFVFSMIGVFILPIAFTLKIATSK